VKKLRISTEIATYFQKLYVTGVLRAHNLTAPTAPPMRLPIPNSNPNPKTHPNPNPIFNPNPNLFLKENKNDTGI